MYHTILYIPFRTPAALEGKRRSDGPEDEAEVAEELYI